MDLTENSRINDTRARLGEERKKFNLDLAFKEVGGFGFAQTLALLCFSILRNSGNYLFYSFPYLTLKQ